MVEPPMDNPKKDLAKTIDASENLPHHQKEYLALGEKICKFIPFKDYFYFRFGFEPKDVDENYLKSSKSSIEEPSFSTSLSNEEEKGTKNKDSSNPSTSSSIMRFFGFSSRRVSKSCDLSTTRDGESSSYLKEYEENPCAN